MVEADEAGGYIEGGGGDGMVRNYFRPGLGFRVRGCSFYT
jgi:hypothetical protein